MSWLIKSFSMTILFVYLGLFVFSANYVFADYDNGSDLINLKNKFVSLGGSPKVFDEIIAVVSKAKERNEYLKNTITKEYYPQFKAALMAKEFNNILYTQVYHKLVMLKAGVMGEDLKLLTDFLKTLDEKDRVAYAKLVYGVDDNQNKDANNQDKDANNNSSDVLNIVNGISADNSQDSSNVSSDQVINPADDSSAAKTNTNQANTDTNQNSQTSNNTDNQPSSKVVLPYDVDQKGLPQDQQDQDIMLNSNDVGNVTNNSKSQFNETYNPHPDVIEDKNKVDNTKQTDNNPASSSSGGDTNSDGGHDNSDGGHENVQAQEGVVNTDNNTITNSNSQFNDMSNNPNESNNNGMPLKSNPSNSLESQNKSPTPNQEDNSTNPENIGITPSDEGINMQENTEATPHSPQ